VSDLPKSTNSSAAPGYVGRMTSKKSGHLGSEIALLQHGFADESVPGLYDVCQTIEGNPSTWLPRAADREERGRDGCGVLGLEESAVYGAGSRAAVFREHAERLAIVRDRATL
jgi:hypothetical protein